MNLVLKAALALLCPCSLAFAAPPDNDAIPAATHLDRLASPASADAHNTQHLTDKDLVAHPELAMALLDSAVREGQWSVVRAVLPLYAASPQPDPLLLQFAAAGLARSEGHYAQAIDDYRTILSAQPDLAAVRLELARALYEDNQTESAAYQFRRVLASEPPEAVQRTIAQYLQRAEQGRALTGTLSLSYLNDSNVNNASTGSTIRVGDREFLRNKESFPQRGEGVAFSGALQKDLPLVDRHGLRFLGTVNGKTYWNNHDFDDITSRLYAGYQWRSFRQQFTLLPFYEKRWYGTEAYSSGPGVRTEYSYLLSPTWQIGQALEWQKLGYDNRDYDFLRGVTRYASTTLSHALTQRVSLFGGVDWQEQQTRTPSESYHRGVLRSGMQVDLPWKISFSAMAAFSRRSYEADSDIFGVRRRDSERFYTLAVWHRDLYFWGVMPKINLSDKRVNSNIDFYDYHQRSVTLSLDKFF